MSNYSVHKAQAEDVVGAMVERATAPDVARLVEAARNLRRRQRAYLEQPKGERDESKGRLVGDAARELDEALAPFNATQPAVVDEAMVEAVRHRVGCHDGLDITPAQVRSVLKHWRIESLAAQQGGQG